MKRMGESELKMAKILIEKMEAVANSTGNDYESMLDLLYLINDELDGDLVHRLDGKVTDAMEKTGKAFETMLEAIGTLDRAIRESERKG